MNVRRGWALLLALALLSLPVQSIRAETNKVILTDISGNVTEDTYIDVLDTLAYASGVDARLIVFVINTPGGEADVVQRIMTAIEGSNVPVCVYVSPIGATAWSGGTYVLIASDVAAMASGASIGSAQPVLSTGVPLNDTKYINALKALMVNHSFYHGRNTTAAGRFVSDNLNLGPSDALRYNVIEIVADDLSSLLVKLSSKSQFKVELSSGEVQWRLVDSGELVGFNNVTRRDYSGIEGAEIVRYNPRELTTYTIRNTLALAIVPLLGFFSFLIWKVIQIRGEREKTGYAYIDGEEGVATSTLSPIGEVRLAGEMWRAESVEGRIEAGANVVVVRRLGLTIYVKRKRS